MITHDARRSLSRDNNPVPSPWEAASLCHFCLVRVRLVVGIGGCAGNRDGFT